LRALQEGEIERLGDTHTRRVDVRVMAATNVDLRTEVRAGRFREDLFFRLNVFPIRITPLRERRDDIPLLAAHFLRKHCGAAAPTLSPDALDVLVADPWPGNVRELENALLHAIAFHHGDLIGRASLPAQIGARSTTGGAPPETAPPDPAHLLPLSEAKRQVNATFERGYLMKVLERARGSVSEAARLAGIDRTNLRRLLKRYEIQSDAFRANRR
jgi:two-component system response regulator AtoC